MADPPVQAEAPAWIARTLLRAARSGTLATATGGQPFASLVTPAVADDGAVLMLLSGLSVHTHHLMAEPRCSVMVVGPAAEANPQTAPRVTITGVAMRDPDPALKARWLAVHPYAALYADFADFALWRVAPQAGLLVSGFARASRLRRADLAPPAAATAAIAAAASGIIGHCNEAHPDALVAIAQANGGGEDKEGWRMVGVDVDGCDLGQGTRTLRVAWSGPASDAMEVRTELVRLAREARQAIASA
jgi:heme iron utilization protein